MTPSQEHILSLLRPHKKYRSRDVAKIMGVATDYAANMLRKMAKDGLLNVVPGPSVTRYKLYSVVPKYRGLCAQSDKPQERGSVWNRTWPEADPVVTQAMRAICEVRT